MGRARSTALVVSLISALASVAHAQGTGPATGRGGPGATLPSHNMPGSQPGMPSTSPGTGSGTTFMPGGSASGMTTPQAMSTLQAQGYSNVQNLQRNGNIYTGTATRNGQTVPVTINANTGQVTPQ